MKMNMMKWLLSVVCLIATAVVGQNDKKYPFIKYEANRLIMPPDSSLMMKFYDKMDNFYTGDNDKLTILHIGGSHVQAGTWTGTFIKQIQNYDGKKDGGGAFVFPYKVVKANSPLFYKSFGSGIWKRSRSANKKEFCSPLGIAGIAAITNDSNASFGIKLEPNEHFSNFKEVRVLHNFNTSFMLSVADGFPVASKREDLPAKGYTIFYFARTVDSINFKITKRDTLQHDFIVFGMIIDSHRPGIMNVVIGANGASTKSILRCDLFTEQLERTLCCLPDMVILSLGVNDVQGVNFDSKDYAEHYDSLIAKIRKVAPQCVILFTTTSDNYVRRKYPNKKSATVEKATIILAAKHKAVVWDLYEIMGGYKSIYKWMQAGLAGRDKVHFSGKGYTILGNLMFEALDKSYVINSKKKKA